MVQLNEVSHTRGPVVCQTSSLLLYFGDSPDSTVLDCALQLPASLKEVTYNICHVGRQGMNRVTEVIIYYIHNKWELEEMKLSNSLHYTKVSLRKYISHLNNIKIHTKVQSFTASLVLLCNRTNSIANYIPIFSSTHALLLRLKFHEKNGGKKKNHAKFKL